MHRTFVRSALTKDDHLTEFVKAVSQTPTNNVHDMKHKRKHIGDTWEDFCADYLVTIAEYTRAIKLAEVSADQLELYGLKKRDVGIDMIAFDKMGNPTAVQCKFRTRGAVSWRELATFEALCNRTGPWKKHLVMTNQKKLQREGSLNMKDAEITRKDLSKMERHHWMLLAGMSAGNILGGTVSNRLAWLDRIDTLGKR